MINVSRYLEHPLFDSYLLDYDFCLLELITQIVFDSATKAPISLPGINDVIADNSAVLVSGWGDTLSNTESSSILRAVTVNVMNFNQCEEIYRDYGGVTDRMICAKSHKKDSCQG